MRPGSKIRCWPSGRKKSASCLSDKRRVTHSAASSKLLSEKVLSASGLNDEDNVEWASCIRSGISCNRITSSSSVNILARISDGSKTCRIKNQLCCVELWPLYTDI